jgi:glutamate-1-semialdehyde aminotransferase
MISNYKNSEIYRSKIHDLIPGGAHTYSKGDDQFPLMSPAAIKRGKGAYVWDVDDNQFLDCSMGLTSVGLGHAYEPVLEAVRRELELGVNFQRPSYIELEMAEKFLSLIPQHQMIKFAKNGSIVTTAAVKLARAYTNRKLVAFPFDHPFYSYDDWFIGTTLGNKGVPEEITALSVTYKADDLNSLKEIFAKYPNQIACVISEPEKWTPLPPNYLEDAIKFVQSQGSVYILDEMITGFKTDLPGSIKKYNVSPDIATWGKGIANGFSFSCMTGKKEIMEIGGIRKEGSERVFLTSTTHGGETHAIAAGISTINEYQNKNIIQHNHKIGKLLSSSCKELITKHNLQDYIEVLGDNWMQVFVYRNKNKEVCMGMRTFFMQEMIKRGVLFQTAFVPCFSHNEQDIMFFCSQFEECLKLYQNALTDGYQAHLIGQPTKPVFRKYN